MGYILFDLDGTLLNTRDGIVECIQKALAQEGIIIDDLALLERHIGPPLKDGFKEFDQLDEETADRAVLEFRKHYMKLGIPGTHPYEGIKECLKGLKDAGFHLCVATSKPEYVAKWFLEHFDMTVYFEHISGSDDSGEQIRTTKAQVIQYLLKHTEITKEDEVTMVGDRFHDVEGAKEFGIPCVGVEYGFGSREELMNAGAITVVKNCTELYEYFCGHKER